MTLTVLAIVALAVAIGTLRGLHQAQVMVKPTDRMHSPQFNAKGAYFDYCNGRRIMCQMLEQFDLGPRGHRWFQHYHAIDGGKDGLLWFHGAVIVLAFAIQCIATVISMQVVPTWFLFQIVAEDLLPNYIAITALCWVIIWTGYELAYSYGRYARFDNGGNPEHVTFFDLLHWYVPVAWMTAIRLGLVILFAAMMGVAI